MDLLNCYNKGCGQKFDPSKNDTDSCMFHSGVPVFHDALKGWSCCKKRSTDFTEFLNIPGCTKGSHIHEKPAEVIQPKAETCKEKPKNAVKEDPLIQVCPPTIREPLEKQKPIERPPEDQPKIELNKKVAQTLIQALEKQMKNVTLASEQNEAATVEVTEGTSCKNNGCKTSYQNEQSNMETCIHHPGVPIFHEGMKYWTCCKRKTTDFDNFLNQEGCVTGRHLWIKKEDPNKKKVACRHDWHQTATFVTVSIFSKLAIPEKCVFKANPVALEVYIAFDGGNTIFEESIVLNGVIDPEKSHVKMLGTKVEINLRKAEAGSWSALDLKKSSISEAAS